MSPPSSLLLECACCRLLVHDSSACSLARPFCGRIFCQACGSPEAHASEDETKTCVNESSATDSDDSEGSGERAFSDAAEEEAEEAEEIDEMSGHLSATRALWRDRLTRTLHVELGCQGGFVCGAPCTTGCVRLVGPPKKRTLRCEVCFGAAEGAPPLGPGSAGSPV